MSAMPDVDWLPSKKEVLVKDLSMSGELVPGNPFCRWDTETNQRTYASSELWEDVSEDEQYLLPEGEEYPKPLVMCQVCNQESWKTGDGECGRCGAPIFDCPNCEIEVHGKVDECPNCEADYKWPEDEE